MIYTFIIFLLVFIVVFLITNKNPDFIFWLSLMLFFDPGGFIEGYLGGDFIGILNITDIMMVPIIISMISIKNKPNPFDDKDFRVIYRYLIIYLLFFVLVYGWLVPMYFNRDKFVFFLIKNRLTFYGFIILPGVYIFTKRSLKLFFKIFVFFAFTILVLYFITLLTGLQIVPVYEMERYRYVSGYQRIYMPNYGLINWIFPIGFIIYLLKRKLPLRIQRERIIFSSAILMIITLLITLTRREFLNVGFTILLLTYLIGYFFRISQIKMTFRVFAPSAIAIIILLIIMPHQLKAVTEVFMDTVITITTGHNRFGEEEYRIKGTGDLEIAKKIISENFLLGTGYVPWLWSETVEQKKFGNPLALAWDASAEVPIYGAFMRFGIVGILILIPIYIFLLKRIRESLRWLKHYIRFIKPENYVPLIFLVFTFYYFISGFTFRFFELFYEFYASDHFVISSVVLGLFFSLRFKLFSFNSEIKKY